MRYQMQNLLWKKYFQLGCIFLICGFEIQFALSQQPPDLSTFVDAKSVVEPKPESDGKAAIETAAKPGTSRPDPRRPAGQPKLEPKTDKQLADERKMREAARKRGEITFDDLKFDIEKDGKFKPEMITKSLMELDKKSFTIRGFILPASVFQQSGIQSFVLVRDNQECCFGPGALLYDCVMIEMAPGKSTTFATRVVTVKGKLEIDLESYKDPDNGYTAVYKMTAEEVK